MPKSGFVTFTVKTEDLERLKSAAEDIIKDAPVKIETLSPAEQLRLLLDEHDQANIEPEEEG